MRSTFTGIETAMRAINAMQLALDTTTHNIANATTPGYSRQRVELSASEAYTKPSMYRIPQPIQIGTGVNIDGLERVRDIFIDRQVRAASADLGNAEATVKYYDRIEALINEPSSSEFSSQLANFWNSWNELSLDPADLSARAVVLEAGASVTDTMNRTNTQLTQLRADVAEDISYVVPEINQLAQGVADLNKEIVKLVGLGQTPNDLLDRRDLMIDDLAKLTGATVSLQADGSANIALDGRLLVDGLTVDPLQTQAAGGGNIDIVWSSDSAAVTLPASELGALQTMNNTTLPDILTDFNDYFTELTTGVNAIHQNGYGLTDPAGPPPGRDFFVVTGGVYSVNPVLETDPELVGAAQSAGVPGDNSNALALANLASTKVTNGGTTTYSEHYTLIVTDIGADAQRQINAVQTHQSLTSYFETQRQSVSGVSIDEEVANLVKFQRAYEAAARAMTVADEALDIIINRMGLVGR